MFERRHIMTEMHPRGRGLEQEQCEELQEKLFSKMQKPQVDPDVQYCVFFFFYGV